MKHCKRQTRSTFGAALGLALLAIAPVACSEEPEIVEEISAPEGPEGISITGGRLSLPAVSGNPGSVYFTITNDSDDNAMIRSAFVDGSESATLHMTTTWNLQTDMQEVFQQPVVAGETLVFEPGGLHVMVNGLEDSLAVGGTAEVTLTFTGGDKISFDAAIRAAGDES